MDFVSIVFGVVDLPLIIGIVVIIEVAKRVIKLPAKAWTLVLILAGFGAAFLKVEKFEIKTLIVQGIIYAAAAEFAYQGWKTITKRRGK